jgi:hypothetical protein
MASETTPEPPDGAANRGSQTRLKVPLPLYRKSRLPRPLKTGPKPEVGLSAQSPKFQAGQQMLNVGDNTQPHIKLEAVDRDPGDLADQVRLQASLKKDPHMLTAVQPVDEKTVSLTERPMRFFKVKYKQKPPAHWAHALTSI